MTGDGRRDRAATTGDQRRGFGGWTTGAFGLADDLLEMPEGGLPNGRPSDSLARVTPAGRATDPAPSGSQPAAHAKARAGTTPNARESSFASFMFQSAGIGPRSGPNTPAG
jgi:hypothetical protein